MGVQTPSNCVKCFISFVQYCLIIWPFKQNCISCTACILCMFCTFWICSIFFIRISFSMSFYMLACSQNIILPTMYSPNFILSTWILPTLDSFKFASQLCYPKSDAPKPWWSCVLKCEPKLPANRWGDIVTLIAFVCLSPLCVIKCILKLPAQEDAKSRWLQLFNIFAIICFHMHSHITCMWGVLTLAAIAWLFATANAS